jgi:DEP domain-containing protein 5
VRKIDFDSAVASHIEISFRDQYIGRSDMWQLKNSIINTSVYNGKKITSLGVRGVVKDIYVNGSIVRHTYLAT